MGNSVQDTQTNDEQKVLHKDWVTPLTSAKYRNLALFSGQINKQIAELSENDHIRENVVTRPLNVCRSDGTCAVFFSHMPMRYTFSSPLIYHIILVPRDYFSDFRIESPDFQNTVAQYIMETRWNFLEYNFDKCPVCQDSPHIEFSHTYSKRDKAYDYVNMVCAKCNTYISSYNEKALEVLRLGTKQTEVFRRSLRDIEKVK